MFQKYQREHEPNLDTEENVLAFYDGYQGISASFPPRQCRACPELLPRMNPGYQLEKFSSRTEIFASVRLAYQMEAGLLLHLCQWTHLKLRS
jgi:hypothetical protein